MGRGGRSGGGGGSSHSSSGGSRGFGMHSSGSSRGGYNGGSHSSGIHSSGSFHSGVHYHGGPTFINVGAPPLNFAANYIVKIFFIFFIFSMFLSVIPSGKTDNSITKSTIQREKLDSSYVNETDEYCTDTLNWISSEYTLEEGMKYFYNKTGVQPYLYITDNRNGDKSGNYQKAICQDFANKIYDELFTDEGHILVVFCEYSQGNYVSFYTVGKAAKTVIDEQAGDILLDYIDHFYYSDYDDDEFFSKSFKNAGDRIMTVQKSHKWIVVTAVIMLIAIIIIIMFLKKRQKQKAENLKRAQDILNTPLDEYGNSSDNAENLAGKYENKE